VATVFIYVLGTFSLHVFGITALWAQLFSTVFALWAMVAFNLWLWTNSWKFLLLSMVMSLGVLFSHTIGIGLMLVYYGVFLVQRKNLMLMVPLVLIAALIVFVLGWRVFSDYVFGVDLWYVLSVFANPGVWILAALGFVTWSGMDGISRRTVGITAILVFAVSPFFTLWRPLISVLPVFSLYAANGLDWLRDKTNKWVFVLLLLVLLVIFSMYFYDVMNRFLSSMVWEMEVEPGIADGMPRNMSSGPLKDILGVSGNG
jgi:hypothetical protein